MKKFLHFFLNSHDENKKLEFSIHLSETSCEGFFFKLKRSMSKVEGDEKKIYLKIIDFQLDKNVSY
jgi:hypothetical protein